MASGLVGLSQLISSSHATLHLLLHNCCWPVSFNPINTQLLTTWCRSASRISIYLKDDPSTQTSSPSRNGIILPRYNMYGICHYIIHYLRPFYIIIIIVDLYHQRQAKIVKFSIVQWHDIHAAIDRLETESCSESHGILIQ